MDMPDMTRYAAATETVAVDDSVLLHDVPEVKSLLGDPTWGNGVAKGERMLIAIWKTSGAVTLIAKVGNPPLKLVAEGQGYDEAVAAVEASLRMRSVPWQRDDNPVGGKQKKKK